MQAGEDCGNVAYTSDSEANGDRVIGQGPGYVASLGPPGEDMVGASAHQVRRRLGSVH